MSTDTRERWASSTGRRVTPTPVSAGCRGTCGVAERTPVPPRRGRRPGRDGNGGDVRPPATVRGRTAVQLLRDRTFGPFILGKILSSCGNWIQQIAAAVLMYELTRSAFMVGAVSVL